MYLQKKVYFENSTHTSIYFYHKLYVWIKTFIIKKFELSTHIHNISEANKRDKLLVTSENTFKIINTALYQDNIKYR